MASSSSAERMVDHLCKKQTIDGAFEPFESDVSDVDFLKTLVEINRSIPSSSSGKLPKPTEEEVQRLIHSYSVAPPSKGKELLLPGFVWRQIAPFDCVTRDDVNEEVWKQVTLSGLNLPRIDLTDEKGDLDRRRRSELKTAMRCIAFALHGRIAYHESTGPMLRSEYTGNELENLDAVLCSPSGRSYEISISLDDCWEENAYREGGELLDVPHFGQMWMLKTRSDSVSVLRLQAFHGEVVGVVHQLNTILDPDRRVWSILKIVDEYLGGTARAVWKNALEMLFPPVELRKNDLVAALRRGIELIHQIPEVANPSLRLLLAVSGVETILSTGTGNVSKDLARRSAAMAAGEPRDRTKWIRFFSQLYDVRSAIVHGRKTDCSEDDARNAWLWAVEVYRSTFYRLQFVIASEGMSNLPNKREFCRALDSEIDEGMDQTTEFVVAMALREAAGIDQL